MDERSCNDDSIDVGFAQLDQALSEKLHLPLTDYSQRHEYDDEETETAYIRSRIALKNRFGTFLKRTLGLPHVPDSDKICLAASYQTVLDNLITSISKPGDTFLVLSPLPEGTDFYLRYRTGVHLINCDTLLQQFLGERRKKLNMDIVESELTEICQKHKVKGVIMSNPMYSLGAIFGKTVMSVLVDFIERHKLHLIIDETLTFFMLDLNIVFSTLLKWMDDLCLDRLHIIWDLSEIFRLDVMPFAAVFTTSPIVAGGWTLINRLYPVPLITLGSYYTLLADPKWICEVFLRKRLELMKLARKTCEKHLMGMVSDIDWRAACAGKVMCISVDEELDGIPKKRQLIQDFIINTKGTINLKPLYIGNWFVMTYFCDESVLSKGLEILQSLLDRVGQSRSSSLCSTQIDFCDTDIETPGVSEYMYDSYESDEISDTDLQVASSCFDVDYYDDDSFVTSDDDGEGFYIGAVNSQASGRATSVACAIAACGSIYQTIHEASEKATLETNGKATRQTRGKTTLKSSGVATRQTKDKATHQANGKATVETKTKANRQPNEKAAVETKGKATRQISGKATLEASSVATYHTNGRAIRQTSGKTTCQANGKATLEAYGVVTRQTNGKATCQANGKAIRQLSGKATLEASGVATRPTNGKATCQTTGKATLATSGKPSGLATREASGKATRQTSGKATHEACGKATCEASGKATHQTSGMAICEASGKATHESSGKVIREASGKVIREASGKVTREANGKATREASGKATHGSTNPEASEASGRVTTEASDEVTSEGNSGASSVYFTAPSRARARAISKIVNGMASRPRSGTSSRPPSGASGRRPSVASSKASSGACARLPGGASGRASIGASKRPHNEFPVPSCLGTEITTYRVNSGASEEGSPEAKDEHNTGGDSEDEEGLETLARQLFQALRSNKAWIEENTKEKVQRENPHLWAAMNDIIKKELH